MRDIFSEIFESEPIDPMVSARRGGRAKLRTRFYREATAGEGPVDFAIRLDGKPVRTPGGRFLAAPTRALAEALAAEWQAQGEAIDPAAMPLTRLANTIIDGVAAAPGPVAEEIGSYLGSDLVFYRAEGPEGLLALQAKHWDPVIEWAADALGARFILAQGVVFAAQSDTALKSARVAIPNDPDDATTAWQLGALSSITTLTGSALLALALAAGRLTVDQAWTAAHVDEDWNMDYWGRDELALERRDFRFKEMQAAALMLAALRS